MNIHKKFFSKIGFSYFILGLSALIFQIILVNIIYHANITPLYDYNLFTILTAVCNYILPLPIFLYMMKKLERERIDRQSIGIATLIKYIAITFTLMWAGNIIGLIITSLLGGVMQGGIENPVETLINSSDIMINLLLISIIGPIFEELIFRKVLVDRTIKYGARVSIILSAIIFGFFHGNLNQFFYAFLMGGFFAYVYIKTGKIIYSIILHITVNLMGSVVSIFVAQSAETLAAGSIDPVSVIIIGVYAIIFVVSMFIGSYSLANYKKSKFNGAKTKINLKHPLKTMLLNYGMILFILFCICEIIIQIMG